MAESFFERPILNSPYEVPRLHHALDEDGQPLDLPPVEGRRRSELITPVPKPRKRKSKEKGKQDRFVFGDEEGLSSSEQEYNPTPIINEIRSHVASWRNVPNPNDWGVAPATARLLTYWRHHNFEGLKPFFCQIEAVETIIWLTEVARQQGRYAKFWEHIKGANEQANPELLRIAMKMATGSGKTTVMAMLIAWQTVNAARSPTSSLFSRGFLIVTPGITIRDRLRVLLPEDPENYYRTRELLPADMVGEIGKAKIIITNYHAFKRRETMEISKVGRALLQGRNEPPVTTESEGQMLQRACGELLGLKNVVVTNDEAHHCYRHKELDEEEENLKGDDKQEAEKNNEAARLWINGIEALKRKVGVRAVYDLSATPFFLRGSGYAEGTLFPWTVSDFSLMDAIECGIVKLPRVPVADNLPAGDMPMYRNLWVHIGKKMPKKGRGKSGTLDPLDLPPELQTALYALYDHYAKTFEEWKRAAIEVPPVFIVVCNNTSTSQLVYEWISGWDREEDGERQHIHDGHLELFRNYDEWSDNVKGLHNAWWELRLMRQKKIDDSIARKADFELLYDRPYEDKSRVRVSGPFTVESLSPHRVVPADEEEVLDTLKAAGGKRRRAKLITPPTDFADIVLENLRAAGVHQHEKKDSIHFTSLQPWPGEYIGAEGHFLEGETERRAAIFLGPEFGTVSRLDLVAAAREASEARFDVLIACAFNFDAHASELTRLGPLPILKAKMNPDLHMADELKSTGKGNLFVVFGEPDIDIEDVGDGMIQVRVKGVDVFDPNTGEIRSNDTKGIAAWFIDTAYDEENFFVRHAYFLGAQDPYKSLKTALKAEIDEDAWSTLYRDVSRPFPRPANGRIAVKVINHFGDEVMKVFGV